MASDIAQEYTEQQNRDNVNPPTDAFSRSRSRESNNEGPVSTSSYTLASENSEFSDDVDLWIRGNHDGRTIHTAVQDSRVTMMQRSTLAPTMSLDANGWWYVVAMILPLFGGNNYFQWRCTSSMINAAEILRTNMSRFCASTRATLRRLAQDQMARDLFASAMDVVLVVYAIGFLVLSLYQAAIFT